MLRRTSTFASLVENGALSDLVDVDQTDTVRPGPRTHLVAHDPHVLGVVQVDLRTPPTGLAGYVGAVPAHDIVTDRRVPARSVEVPGPEFLSTTLSS